MIGILPRVLRSLAIAVVLASFFGSIAHAQGTDAYPSKPVRMVVPYAPGGPIDVWGRILAQKLSESLGRPVVLDNKPGANGIVGTDIVAKSAPDGHTMLYQTGSHVANVSMYKKLPYDSVRDFSPIMQMASTHGMVLVVHPTVPAMRMAAEYFAYTAAAIHAAKASQCSQRRVSLARTR